jgi:hypothetical protein
MGLQILVSRTPSHCGHKPQRFGRLIIRGQPAEPAQPRPSASGAEKGPPEPRAAKAPALPAGSPADQHRKPKSAMMLLTGLWPDPPLARGPPRWQGRRSRSGPFPPDALRNTPECLSGGFGRKGAPSSGGGGRRAVSPESSVPLDTRAAQGLAKQELAPESPKISAVPGPAPAFGLVFQFLAPLSRGLAAAVFLACASVFGHPRAARARRFLRQAPSRPAGRGAHQTNKGSGLTWIFWKASTPAKKTR